MSFHLHFVDWIKWSCEKKKIMQNNMEHHNSVCEEMVSELVPFFYQDCLIFVYMVGRSVSVAWCVKQLKWTISPLTGTFTCEKCAFDLLEIVIMQKLLVIMKLPMKKSLKIIKITVDEYLYNSGFLGRVVSENEWMVFGWGSDQSFNMLMEAIKNKFGMIQ